MQDRTDLIESELSGLGFDSLQQFFRGVDLDIMFSQAPPVPVTKLNEPIHLFIDPAAGGPGSDYAVLSVTRQEGMITVRPPHEARAPYEAGGWGHDSICPTSEIPAACSVLRWACLHTATEAMRPSNMLSLCPTSE